MVTALAAPRVRTAAITNLGCKVNQAEMEAAARRLRELGIAIVDGDRRADLVLVNTCTVTSEADAKSRHAVRRARRASPDAPIVVTGCSVQVDRAAFLAADRDATLVDNRAKDALLAELDRLLGPGRGSAGGDVPGPGRGSFAGHELPGVRPGPAPDRQQPRPARLDGAPPRAPRLDGALPTLSGVEIEGIADGRASVERTRAFVKVQDGCSFFCTYCIIPTARGPERSLPPDVVLGDVRQALAAGHREVVLTGINIGTYDGGWSERGFRGAHTRSALDLPGLIRRILDETDVERVRISSIEPQHVDDALLRAWADGGPRTLPHVHLPLQSGDDGVLRRMGRRYRSEAYATTVARVREAIPGVAVHADAIVGFPTEDDAAWRRSLAFIRSLGLAGLHVFRYSARPGTPAVRMTGQVDEPTKKRRAAELLTVAADCRARWATARVGTDARVLLEDRLPGGGWTGHAEDHTLVAIDAPAEAALENAIANVRITGVDRDRRDRVVGRILSLSPATAHGASA